MKALDKACSWTSTLRHSHTTHPLRVLSYLFSQHFRNQSRLCNDLTNEINIKSHAHPPPDAHAHEQTHLLSLRHSHTHTHTHTHTQCMHGCVLCVQVHGSPLWLFEDH